MPHPAFAQTDHRPWSLPDKPWIMQQVWSDLLFLHWSVDAELIRSLLPPGVELDLYQGEAYIALVPFNMYGVTPRGCPAPKIVSDFPEFNVRTYVTRDGKPGVWFFSLDVTNKLAVWVARTLFNLPYRHATMSAQTHNGWTEYKSDYNEQERFHAQYRKTTPYDAPEASFAHWATERYCLYTHNKHGHIYRGEIQHPKWKLSLAECNLLDTSILDQFAPLKMQPPLLADRIEVVVYPLERL